MTNPESPQPVHSPLVTQDNGVGRCQKVGGGGGGGGTHTRNLRTFGKEPI